MQFSGCRCRWGHKDQQRDRNVAVDEEKGPLRVEMLVLQQIMLEGEEIITRKETWV